MKKAVENILLVLVPFLTIVNITVMCLPVWYRKEHEHNVNGTAASQKEEVPSCTIHMHIREGLWQRYCKESWRKGKHCEVDVQEWCDNLDYPAFNSFVVGVQIVGDLFLIFAFATIIRSKITGEEFNMEMVGTGIGLAGILMELGGTVYASADTGELDYRMTDLHIGWGMCVAVGLVSVVVCVCCMCQHVRKTHLTFSRGYFPISDDDDVELISV